MNRRQQNKNARGFERAFLAVSERIQQKAKEALIAGAQIVVNDAKSLCPDETGKLKASIAAKPNKNGTRIRITAPAQNEDNGVHYGQLVEFWPGREHPFMYPAMDANRETIREMIRRAVSDGVKKT